MKTDRNVHKTMRIPEKLVQFIENFPGDSFNDKVNNLLEFYSSQDAEYRKEIRRLDAEIKYRQELLEDFGKELQRYKDLLKI